MQVQETLNEGLKREYQVTIAAADIEGRVAGRLGELAQTARLPGFRPGKAPVSLLRKMHGRAVLGEVLQQTLNESTAKALQERELRPALQPKVEILKFSDGADLEYKVSIELLPDVDPGDFAELEIERLVAAVSEEEVSQRLQRLADDMKSYVAAAEGQGAQNGDRLTLDFVGSLDGKAFSGGSATDYALVLGGGGFVPGFEDSVVGLKAGESRRFPLSFPADYAAKNLAGKAVEFAVTVKKVEVALPTAVDDGLAEKLGLKTLDELRGTVQQAVSREHAMLSRARTKRRLLDALAERHRFAVPEGMVEMEFQGIWQQFEAEMKRQGKAEAEWEKPVEALKAEYWAIAERRVRLGLLLSEVGRRQNLQVTQEELNRAIAEQARRFPGQEQRVFQFYQQNQEAQTQLKAPILEDKVCDFILEMAKVSEREVALEELLREPDEPAAPLPVPDPQGNG
ncbi:MAG: trigger factor [Alphaproteobacteria bacterium]|nr:trigger factor [Alphaproteobacteria bacterium]